MTPTVKYSPEDNAAYIRFSNSRVQESEEVSEGIVFDFDQDGRIVGIELLNAAAQLPSEMLTKAA